MRLLLAFNSEGLGGTSRTAVQFAKLWAEAGADITVYVPRRPHPSRRQELERLGIPVIGPSDLPHLAPVDVLHLHHFAPSPETVEWVEYLCREALHESCLLITHNIFGHHLPVTSRHKFSIVGVLGTWLAWQYRLQRFSGRTGAVKVMPNPQDFVKFRPPSITERARARDALNIGESDKILLRVGSRLEDKWDTSAYYKLAKRVIESESHILRLLGAPKALREQLPEHARIQFVETVSDDKKLIQEYWAADIFVHWARRGESFGNVILEAVGTGLPIIYKSREFRDNTPWEFQQIPGFVYCASGKDWFDASMTLGGRRTEFQEESVLAYSDQMIKATLRKIVDICDTTTSSGIRRVDYMAVCETLQDPAPIPVSCAAKVYVRHNPLSSLIKSTRLSLKNPK